MDKPYQIIYTESAVRDLEEKADYISFQLHDPNLAETWYFRLRAEILKDLTQMPYKYPLCQVEKWRARGVRQFAFRNDVVLYSVDGEKHIVFIRAVATKGRDIPAHLDEST